MMFNSLVEFAAYVANDFRNYEQHEIVVFADRDASLVEFVIRCLVNPRNEFAEPMVETIYQQLSDNQRVMITQQAQADFDKWHAGQQEAQP